MSRPGSPGQCELSGVWPWFWSVIWVVAGAFLAGQVLAGGVFRFPSDWDTLMYHLPLVDHWIQARSLYAPGALRWSDPGNNEVVTLWLVGPFSGDFLYALTNLPAAVLLACIAVELGRQIGLRPGWRNCAGLAVASNHVVFRQLTSTENDIAVAALFLASLTYGLRYLAARRAGDLVVGAIALGLLAGVKYYALGYATVAGALIAGLIARRVGWRAGAYTLAVGSVGLLMFAGYWYVRNWAMGGSPLYPLWAPGDGLTDRYPAVWQSTFVGNGSSALLPLVVAAVREMAGPWHLVALLALPATIPWLLAREWAARRVGGEPGGDGRFALAVATVGACGVLVVTPFAVEDVPGTLNQLHWQYCPVRYGSCFLSLAVIALAATLDDLSRGAQAVALRMGRKLSTSGNAGSGKARRLGPVLAPLAAAVVPLVFAGLVVSQVAVPLEAHLPGEGVDALLMGGNALLVVLTGGWLVSVGAKASRSVGVLIRVALAVVMAAAVGWLGGRWHRDYVSYYDRLLAGGAIEYLNRTEPPGTRICILDLRPYPFFGPERQFQIYQPVTLRSLPWWETYLREHGIQLVIVPIEGPDEYSGWKDYRRWFAERPDLFHRIERPGWRYLVYQIDDLTTQRSGRW